MNDGFGLGQPRRFRPDELDVELGPGEESELMSAARDLEWLAAVDDIGPSWDFADRVMVSIQAEPLPRPVVAAYGAARKGRPIAALAALGDLWRVAFGGGSRPLAVRLPAIGLVVLLVAAIGGAGTLGVGALTGAFNGRPDASPVGTPLANEPQPTPTQLETPRTFEPSEPPSLHRSAEPSESPDASPSPDGSEEPGDDTSSTSAPLETDPPNAGGTPRTTPPPARTSEPSKTPKPTPTNRPTRWPRETPRPSDTPRPSEGHGGGGGGGGGGDSGPGD